MPTFDIGFVSTDHPGKRFRERVQARNLAELRQLVDSRRGFLFSYREISAGKGTLRTKLPASAQVQLFNLIAMQLKGGVNTEVAIARLRDEFPHRATRRVLAGIHAELSSSTASLSEAMAKYRRSFPPGVIASVRIGESLGRVGLAKRFEHLRDALAFKIGLRKSALKMLTYPAFITISATSVLSFIFIKVIPLLKELLESFNTDLPSTTRFLISVSDVLRQDGLALGLALVAVVVAFIVARRTPKAATWLDRLTMRLPFFGKIARSLATAEIAKSYRALYDAGEKSPATFSACAEIAGNLALKKALLRARILLESAVLTENNPNANAITEALRSTGYFPEMALTIIDTGEATGNLSEALDNVANHYASEAKERIEIFFAVFEKVLLLAIVSFVGFVVISMIQPIMTANASIH